MSYKRRLIASDFGALLSGWSRREADIVMTAAKLVTVRLCLTERE
jgi:hypothetical protein